MAQVMSVPAADSADFRRALGKVLRALREKREMTLNDVEQATRLSNSTISRLETARGNGLDLGKVAVLAGLYETTLDDLFELSLRYRQLGLYGGPLGTQVA